MFKIPDRVADHFGDHAIRIEVWRALTAAGQTQSYEEKYPEDCPFGEVVRITYGRLKKFDMAALPDDQRELVAGAKALSHRLVTAGHAIDLASKADQRADEDWPRAPRLRTAEVCSPNGASRPRGMGALLHVHRWSSRGVRSADPIS